MTARHNTPYTLAVLDIDHFKRINDTYGHDAGDVVLKEFVDCIKRELRTTDRLARIGGEEFVILMPMTPVPGAVVLIERIRKGLAKQEHAIAYTFSAGVTAGIAEDDKDSVILRADQALYAAKENGRNQTMTKSQGSEPVPASGLFAPPPPPA
jgi:diguanylate cyclase (GGDEF)-like protein